MAMVHTLTALFACKDAVLASTEVWIESNLHPREINRSRLGHYRFETNLECYSSGVGPSPCVGGTGVFVLLSGSVGLAVVGTSVFVGLGVLVFFGGLVGSGASVQITKVFVEVSVG